MGNGTFVVPFRFLLDFLSSLLQDLELRDDELDYKPEDDPDGKLEDDPDDELENDPDDELDDELVI